MTELEVLMEQLEVLKRQLYILRIYTWATVSIAIIALIAGLVTLLQLRGLRHEREWTIANDIMEELRSPERIALQRELWTTPIKPENIHRHRRIGEFELLISRQQWIGIMVGHGAVPLRLVVPMVGASPLRSWYMLSKYVIRERASRGLYGQDFQALVRHTLKWFISHEPVKSWPLLSRGRAGNVIPLIPELVKDQAIFSQRNLRLAKVKRCIFGLRHPTLWKGFREWWGLSTEPTQQATPEKQL